MRLPLASPWLAKCGLPPPPRHLRGAVVFHFSSASAFFFSGLSVFRVLPVSNADICGPCPQLARWDLSQFLVATRPRLFVAVILRVAFLFETPAQTRVDVDRHLASSGLSLQKVGVRGMRLVT